MKVSIIIVNYNSAELLRNCLESIDNELDIDYEVIVVDNASNDNSIALCSRFREDSRYIFIESKDNAGFAKGCNIGAAAASGEILHFLNPDTELQKGSTADYLKVMENPQYIYVTPLINRDGSVENGKMVLPLLSDIFWWNISRKRARFWCKGASVIISHKNFEKVGRWSEDYFMYGEDLDLFYNFWRHNLKIEMLHVPVFHFGGGCSSNVWSTFDREVIVQRSFRRFYSKYFPKWKYVAVKLYFLLHNLIKHPSRVKFDIKAWKKACSMP
ncbi:MAG: glycosyltransferase family 2 protein [Bacteroidales bacterium]|nr:glycosyltransferase family 2 protein [Bacteroidales bacterium]